MLKLTNRNIEDLISKFKAKEQESFVNIDNDLKPQQRKYEERFLSFEGLPAYKQLKLQFKVAQNTGIKLPYFVEHDAMAKDVTNIAGKQYLNFSSYDYLGLNGDPRINAAVTEAANRYGTSAGASRLVAGERPIHRKLEKALAEHYGQEAALAFVSGYATNVTTIATLFGSEDVIFVDKLAHNSLMTGALSSGAHRIVYPHNDISALKKLLSIHRDRYQRALIVTEGIFSMDGNFAPLPELIALKQEFGAFLMVDEAHALGVAGVHGFGSFDHFKIDPKEVDIWMGTLSKSLCSCGGYIAGSSVLIELLKYKASAFVYSVALAPVLAAAALETLNLLHTEKHRVEKLQENCSFALQKAKELNLNTGLAQGTAILPLIVGSSLQAVFLSNLIYEQGVCALPIIYPVVEEGAARLRLFLSASHSHEEILRALTIIKECSKKAEFMEQDFIEHSKDSALGKEV